MICMNLFAGTPPREEDIQVRLQFQAHFQSFWQNEQKNMESLARETVDGGCYFRKKRSYQIFLDCDKAIDVAQKFFNLSSTRLSYEERMQYTDLFFKSLNLELDGGDEEQFKKLFTRSYLYQASSREDFFGRWRETQRKQTFQETLQSVATFGLDGLRNYDTERGDSASVRSKGSLDCWDLVAGKQNREKTGVCRDIAGCQARLMTEAGYKAYVIGYVSQYQGHAVLIAQDPKKPTDLYTLNYDEIAQSSGAGGVGILKQNQRIPDRNNAYEIYDGYGRSIALLPSEIGIVQLELSGGAKVSESIDPFLQQNYQSGGASVRLPGDFIFHGHSFQTTSSGESGEQIAIEKKFQHQLFPLSMALGYTHLNFQDQAIAIGKLPSSGNFAFFRLQQQANTPTAKIHLGQERVLKLRLKNSFSLLSTTLLSAPPETPLPDEESGLLYKLTGFYSGASSLNFLQQMVESEVDVIPGHVEFKMEIAHIMTLMHKNLSDKDSSMTPRQQALWGRGEIRKKWSEKHFVSLEGLYNFQGEGAHWRVGARYRRETIILGASYQDAQSGSAVWLPGGLRAQSQLNLQWNPRSDFFVQLGLWSLWPEETEDSGATHAVNLQWEYLF
jgi:hypothetical protein